MENGNTAGLYTAAEISIRVKISSNNVRARIKKDQISSKGTKLVEHNDAAAYLFDTLPPEWQERITAYEKLRKEEALAAEIAAKLSALKEKEQLDRLKYAEVELPAKLIAAKEHERLTRLESAEEPLNHEDSEWLWNSLAKKGNTQKEKAKQRVLAVHRVRELCGVDTSEIAAIEQAAKEFGFHPNSVRNWVVKTREHSPSNWFPILVNQSRARDEEAECTPEAWLAFLKDFLRKGKGGKPPSIASCYRRLEAAAKENGWNIPIKRTIENWIKRKIDPMVVTFRRYGMQAVEQNFPAMKRNKEMFEVMQAVNGDGFQLGIFVNFGNGLIVKPVVWSWQDTRSSKILAWRMDISENRELIRLALYDLLEWGRPEFIYLDNTRAATSKQISGGLPNRYRFKAKDDDPLGIIPLLGIELKYTLPGHGQSKPVERIHGIGGYLDFDNLPVFEGRGTKARPVPIAEVEELFRSFVNEINARPDRRGDAVQGKSFDQVFNELYSQTVITKVTEKQRNYCLCVAEVVTVNRTDASIALKTGQSSIGQNRYWNEALTGYKGEKVTVRFDPADMHAGVYVETIGGEEICFAGPTSTGGFKDAAAAREHARNKGHFKKHTRLAAEASERMTADVARQYMITTPDPEQPEAKAARLAAGVPSKGKEPAVDQAEADEALTEESTIAHFNKLFKVNKDENNLLNDPEEREAAFQRGVEKLYGNRDKTII
jgi:transposase InsO family protein